MRPLPTRSRNWAAVNWPPGSVAARPCHDFDHLGQLVVRRKKWSWATSCTFPMRPASFKSRRISASGLASIFAMSRTLRRVEAALNQQAAARPGAREARPRGKSHLCRTAAPRRRQVRPLRTRPGLEERQRRQAPRGVDRAEAGAFPSRCRAGPDCRRERPSRYRSRPLCELRPAASAAIAIEHFSDSEMHQPEAVDQAFQLGRRRAPCRARKPSDRDSGAACSSSAARAALGGLDGVRSSGASRSGVRRLRPGARRSRNHPPPMVRCAEVSRSTKRSPTAAAIGRSSTN